MKPSSSSILEKESLRLLREALEKLEEGFAALPTAPAAPGDETGIARVLGEVAERLWDNYPYFHPLYAGQMLKPPHPVARLAYAQGPDIKTAPIRTLIASVRSASAKARSMGFSA